MSENFAELFELSIKQLDMKPGALLSATVLSIENDFIIVDANLKTEGAIAKQEFYDGDGKLAIKVGEKVSVVLENIEDGFGLTKFSREKAIHAEKWQVLEVNFSNQETINGTIVAKVRGGFTVDLGDLHAFLPGSLLDLHPLRDSSHLENCPLTFKIVKLDVDKNNIVVSRRAILEQQNTLIRAKLLGSLKQGQTLVGVVKNITDYGAFVDLGGLDGLLHITDISWKRVKHPSLVLNIGDEISVLVLKYDADKERVSLGLKQLTSDPWTTQIDNLAVGMQTKAIVTNIMDYGCFAQIAEGVEGLIHVSEMDWGNRNIHPSKVVSKGLEVTVKILDIDSKNRRVSLGMKQCTVSPWQLFAEQYKAGDKIVGKIRSITDFGLFIAVADNLDGLVHLSDISWDQPGSEAVKAYKKGDEVEAVLLSVDVEKERVALSIKQLSDDEFGNYVATHKKGDEVKGVITQIAAEQITLLLSSGVDAIIKRSELSGYEEQEGKLIVGQDVDSVIIQLDVKNRQVSLSIKQLEVKQQREAIKSAKNKALKDSTTATIGDLIRAQIEKNENKK
jgi:small subunit ribosomal protein S1